jgi:hypothetical protein
MKYEKPEVVELACAIKAVQNITKNGPIFEAEPTHVAYESDE